VSYTGVSAPLQEHLGDVEGNGLLGAGYLSDVTLPLPPSVAHVVRVAQSHHRAVRRAMQAPGRERDVLVQIGKGAAAAVIAWQVARLALHSEAPFLAPLAALIAVEATVYQSLRTTAQNVTAVLAGVLLAFLTARTLGVEWYSLGLVLVVALGLARWQRLGGSGLQVPTTALLAMTIAGGVQDTMLEARVVETLVGALIGAAINVLVLPPVHLRDGRESVASSARGVSRLLSSIAEGIRTEWTREDAQEWMERARQLDARVRDARSASERGRESMRFNPRATPEALPVDVASLDRAVDSLEHVAVQCRSIAATLLDTVTGEHTRRPTDAFFHLYAEILDDVAAAFAAVGDDISGAEELQRLRGAVRDGGDKWRDLRTQIQDAEVRQNDSFPSYGSLLVDAERTLDELERAEHFLAASTP
jgi:hypothetical protein